MTWHQTIIVGNLGQDPEMRYLQDGNSVCSFRVAVNERWNDRRTGEKRERTTWYRVSAWAALGETCNRYLSKGRQVMAIGSVSVNAFTNREGEPAASLELRAREVRFIGGDRAVVMNSTRAIAAAVIPARVSCRQPTEAVLRRLPKEMMTASISLNSGNPGRPLILDMRKWMISPSSQHGAAEALEQLL